jgi:transcriptional regulator GlxA family with amidase domain
MNIHRVALVAFAGMQPLDLVGPHEVFASANQLSTFEGRDLRYEVSVIAVDDGTIRCESGLRIVADPLPEPDAVDTVLVAGGDGSRQASRDERLITWLHELPATTRIGSICTGAFVLAAAGFLDGRCATTHWALAAQLARKYPNVTVDSDPIFICDDGVWTSAGVTSGIDLALAMVEHDFDAQLAQNVARWLVMFARRPGGQSQFATPVWTDVPNRAPIRDAIHHVQANPEADHSLGALAERSHLSVRHFQRTFVEETGETPAVFVERVRVEHARRLLETTSATVAATARASGFGSAETLRRAFVRRVGVNPEDYRKRFALSHR